MSSHSSFSAVPGRRRPRLYDVRLRGRAGALVPGLRRPLRPRRRPSGCWPRAAEARGDRVRVGDRLLEPLPPLPRHLRLSRHPRTRAADRDGHQAESPGSAGLRRDGRRRLLLDRRRALDPRDPLQHGHGRDAVRQQRLRSDQEADVADHAAGVPDEHAAARQLSTRDESARRRRSDSRTRRSWRRPRTGCPRTSTRRCEAAYEHKGFAFVRILQRCPHFTPDIFQEAVQNPDMTEMLEHPRRHRVPDSGRDLQEPGARHDPPKLDAARALAENPTASGSASSSATSRCPVTRRRGASRTHTAEEKMTILNEELDRYAV